MTVEKSEEFTLNVLNFCNALLKEPITIEDFKKQRAKEKNNRSCNNDFSGAISVQEMEEIVNNKEK